MPKVLKEKSAKKKIQDFKVADLSLAAWGRKDASPHMPNCRRFPGIGYSMAFGMVIIMAIVITGYTLLMRKAERWLR